MQDDLLPLATRVRTLSNQASPRLWCNQLENISIIVLILVDLRGGRCAPRYIQPMTCRGRHWFKLVSERKHRGNLNGNGKAKSLSIVQRMCDIQPWLSNQCSSTEGKKKQNRKPTWKNPLFAADHWSKCIAFPLFPLRLCCKNKARLFSLLNWWRTDWMCH